jgi:hypothetical protein
MALGLARALRHDPASSCPLHRRPGRTLNEGTTQVHAAERLTCTAVSICEPQNSLTVV